jgi:hypothetical protein
MRKNARNLLILAFLWATIGILFPQVTQADFERRILKDLDLKSTPLDVAPSPDGQRLFILTAGEILVYSFQEDKISDRIPVDKEFDRISSLPSGDMLTITSSSKKALQIILLEAIHKIDVTGHPFKGPQDAPVTIAVFTDYQ